ncbi:MAG: PaaI family thioesterase [Bacteroidales bacterium]|nr:PaaI family thioesterase [Bacteroidales bacterium]
MRKIYNPFAGQEGYNCFGCSPHNPYGLKMSFMETEDAVLSEWIFEENYTGYKDVLHGGIQATLMDEIASWYVFVKLKTGGVTSSMQVKYLRPVQGIGQTIRLEARLKEKHHRLAIMIVKLFDQSGELCSESEITYYVFPEELARKRLAFPPAQSFYLSDEI